MKEKRLMLILLCVVSCICAMVISSAHYDNDRPDRLEMVVYDVDDKESELVVYTISEANLPGIVEEADGVYTYIQPAHNMADEDDLQTAKEVSISELDETDILPINYETIDVFIPDQKVLLSSQLIKVCIVNHQPDQTIVLSPEVELEKKIDGKWVRIARDEDSVEPTRRAVAQIIMAEDNVTETKGTVWLPLRYFWRQTLSSGLYRAAVEIGDRVFYAEFNLTEK